MYKENKGKTSKNRLFSKFSNKYIVKDCDAFFTLYI